MTSANELRFTRTECPLCRSPFADVGKKTGKFSGAEFRICRCLRCGLYFVGDPSIDFPNIYNADYYRGLGADEVANYEQETRFFSSTVRRYEWEGILSIVSSKMSVGTDTAWLDYGCGHAGLVKWLNERGLPEAVGYDVGEAAEAIRPAGVTVLSDVTSEGLRGRFDVITAVEVLEHVLDPRQVLADVARLLKPGGVFFFTTGNAQRFEGDIVNWIYVVPEIHINFFTPSSMELGLAEAGLSAERVRYGDGFVNVFRYRVLKTLRVARQNVLERALPWSLAGPLLDRKYGYSAFPMGRKTS